MNTVYDLYLSMIKSSNLKFRSNWLTKYIEIQTGCGAFQFV